ncbi:helix-turn-helix domain-containing protein [Cohnella sp. AR92]|uniref:helix-turn-helix domain-containing protein n=1 Tax=Cohnella sp. AR92 TaxID=648716 RepID=UPI000F8D7509|nr:helix-turn-helix transcriptional regulator [Cohnella sp. AR92]RUS48850.1 XRE family transcriptional regulator [Cohnella sp. AR92]
MPNRQINKGEFEQLKLMELGMRIRFLREQMGCLYSKHAFSTTELAKRLEVTPQSLTSIERGETRNPSFKVICQLAKVFNVPIDAFSDEYYAEAPSRLFHIGFKEKDDTSPDSRHGINSDSDVSDYSDEQQFGIGLIAYQIFTNNEVRVVMKEESNKNVDTIGFVQLLARLNSEIQMANARSISNNPQYLRDNTNVYNRMLNLQMNIFKEPSRYPRVSRQDWNAILQKMMRNSQEELE